MTAETAAPCVQGVQGAQSGMASQSILQQVQDGSGGGGGGGGGGGAGAYYSSTSTSTVYDPEYARMEAWLDEHPDFVSDYFLRYCATTLYESTKQTELSSLVMLVCPCDIASFLLVTRLQESNTANRRHVVGVARDADFIVQQLHGASESDPRRHGWQLVFWPRCRRLGSHDSRT